MGKKLTPKQEAFVREYLIDLNASAAMLRAGYKTKNPDVDGYRLLVNPSVKARIDQAIAKRAEETELSAEWVLIRFKQIVERCMQTEPVLDREGKETGEYTFNASGANKALEMIGKHLKMFTDKVEHSGDTVIEIKKPVFRRNDSDG